MDDDVVNHPSHYTWMSGVEAVDILEQVAKESGWNVANAVKYLLRLDRKGKPEQDMKKAVWYLRREIANRERARTVDRHTLGRTVSTGDSECLQSTVFISSSEDRTCTGK